MNLETPDISNICRCIKEVCAELKYGKSIVGFLSLILIPEKYFKISLMPGRRNSEIIVCLPSRFI